MNAGGGTLCECLSELYRRYLYSAHNVAISPDVVSGPNVVDEHRKESAESDCIGDTKMGDEVR